MSITEETKAIITAAVIKHIPHAEKIILFGSRVDDTKRGGDIDVLVQPPTGSVTAFEQKLRAVSAMQLQLGGQRIDLITALSSDDERLIVRNAYCYGVVLWTK